MYLIERVLHYPYFPRKADGLVSLGLNYILFQFSVSMVAVFGVLFIYQLGYGFFEGISFVLIFYGLQRVAVGLVIPLVGFLISRVGYRRVMFMGLISLVGKLFFLTRVESNILWPLLPALILGGIAIPAYYLPFHALFLDDNNDKKIGEQFGLITMLGGFATVLSPFVAGILIESLGFSAMFNLAIVLLLASSIPLFMMKFHKRHHDSYSFGAIWRFMKNRPKISWSMYWWWLTAGIQAFFWPIFLLLILGSYFTFGVVGSLVIFINSISVYIVGKIYDKRQAKSMFIRASFAVSVTWFMRFLAKSPFGAVSADVLNRVASPPIWMKIRRQELLAGEKIDSLVFGAAHEYLVTFAFISSLIIGFAILSISRGQWALLIIPAVVGTIIAAWVLRNE